MTTTDTTILAVEPGETGSKYADRLVTGEIPFSEIEAMFDFEVEYGPCLTTKLDDDGRPELGIDGGPVTIEVPRKRVIRRTGTNDVFNIVSPSHGIHQFSDVLVRNVRNLLDVPDADLKVVGAGLLDRGAVGWVQVKAPEIVIADDRLSPTLTVCSSHNGRFATSYRTGVQRFFCSNQLGTLRRGGANTYKVKHTRHSAVKVAEARRVLGLMFASQAEFVTEVEALSARSVTTREFEAVLRQIVPAPKPGDDGEVSAAAQTRYEKRFNGLHDLWSTADPRIGPAHGTAWGIVQVFNTYTQHERPMRTVGAEGSTTRLGRNMADFLSGKTHTADRTVVETVKEVVGI